ncbi:TlpA disulfide reductase family protein [Roseateles sp.]|uniref:TlpA family protein disulfide reductase n=1 Tax=Roseateles sp. TaxID=1971397 RepID=UPI0025F5DC67|nr:TlpA disulfide reductase family protein [Roseateles sp.]MBV8037667.1 TlpA family protein disulfide reductase [Roseateles sp.]
MRWRPLCAGLLAFGLAQAAPGADTWPALCPGGPPKTDVQGRPMAADFWRRGPVLAVLWSVDCGFCQRHNERLDRLLREAPGAAVLGVAVDGQPDAVSRAVARRGYDFPVIVDGSGDCALRPQLTPRRVVPMTCWLGDAPTQPRCIPGEMSDEDLRALLRAQARARRQSW